MRYFTPGHEMNLCGHATIAALYCLKSKGLNCPDLLMVETRAGTLPIEFIFVNDILNVKMKQASPEFREYHGRSEDIAKLLGLQKDDIDISIPTVYGSTGTWTLLVPIKSLEAFSRMTPDNQSFPKVLKELPHSSIHPFCFETLFHNSHIHARHFSSPYSGTIEDPVTGTASGVLGVYYLNNLLPNATELELLIEQGHEIDKNGEVAVYINKNENEICVNILGTAVFVKELYVEFS